MITVEFNSRDPELAAEAANTIVREYLDLQTSAKRDNTEEAAGSLGPEVARVREDVEKAEHAVEDFRSANNLLLGSNKVTLVQQQMADVNTQLATVLAQKAEVEAKAERLRSMLKHGSLDSASDVLNSPLIQRLRERQVALQARVAELSTSLLPNHPDYRAAQRQLNDLKAQIVAEGRKILAGLENDVRVTASQVTSLTASLNQLKAEVAQNNGACIQLRDLERDAKVKGAQLEVLLQRYREQEVRVSASGLPADARLISRTTVPHKPYSPRVIPITVLVALAVAVLAIAYILMREFMVDPVLVRSGGGSQEGDEEAEPAAPRTVRTSRRRRCPSFRFPTSRRIRSTDDNEPASCAAIALLRAAVSDNSCPILVETASEPRFDLPGAPKDKPRLGFADLLSGEASFSQVIMRDPRSRAHVDRRRRASPERRGGGAADLRYGSGSSGAYLRSHRDRSRPADLLDRDRKIPVPRRSCGACGRRSFRRSRARRLLESQTGANLSVFAPEKRETLPLGERDMAT
ncbi:GumC family protein [Breoghania sp.]|uniref:GumC family protein n=1 Tax=Breoghania sp. TaxID=2065378 RepID=UPI0026321A23|nr:GumC family protein [Breoghania sp.]MDJ0932329.1 GumC family protein [Breoghania sp.]